MVFVFKRFILHVYGIKTDVRNRFLEQELFDSNRVAICGLIFSESYRNLSSYIDYLCAKFDLVDPKAAE